MLNTVQVFFTTAARKPRLGSYKIINLPRFKSNPIPRPCAPSVPRLTGDVSRGIREGER